MSEKIDSVFLKLESVIEDRMQASPDTSYVSQLNQKGLDTILKKIGEESAEVIIAAKGEEKSAIIYESCDLIFHLWVMLKNQGIEISEIEAELARRFGMSGLVEKENRNK